MARSRKSQGKEAAKAASESVVSVDTQRSLNKLARTARELRAANRNLTEHVDALEARLDSVLAIQHAPIKPYRIKKPTKSKDGRNNGVSVSLCSDLHVEEKVDPKTVSGLNEHNLAIADEKLHRYWHNVVKLVKKEQSVVNIQAHILWLGGDLYTGHIHDDHPETCELSPTQCLVWLRERIGAGIRHLLEHMDVPEIIVACNYGNHGRTTMKPRASTAAKHSYEWLLYQILQADFADEDRIKFLVSDGYHLYVDVSGYIIRFHHGDWVSYYGGVAGLHVPMWKAVQSWNQGRHADLDVFGHFHTKVDLEYAVGNSSLIGYSAYSQKIKAKPEIPQQVLFFIDTDRHRKSGVYPIHVT